MFWCLSKIQDGHYTGHSLTTVCPCRKFFSILRNRSYVFSKYRSKQQEDNLLFASQIKSQLIHNGLKTKKLMMQVNVILFHYSTALSAILYNYQPCKSVIWQIVFPEGGINFRRETIRISYTVPQLFVLESFSSSKQFISSSVWQTNLSFTAMLLCTKGRNRI